MMLRSICASALVALTFVAPAWADAPAPAPAPAPTREKFAARLLAERDYFRAVTVYKELAFFAEDDAARARFAYAIGKAYRLGRRYELAIDTYASFVEMRATAPDFVARAYVAVGASYIGLRVPDQARVWLARGTEHGAGALSSLYVGVADVEDERWEAARASFALAASRAEPRSPLANLALDLARRTQGAEDMPYRSPLFAATLSAVLPGAGQAYSGHWFDAAQALGFVAAFGFVSYFAYRYDDARGGPYVFTAVSLSLTGLLHLANILGAERTARYFNQHQRDLFVAPIRARALEAEF
jgi:tetratricopeptide (TPR) repeat protein